MTRHLAIPVFPRVGHTKLAGAGRFSGTALRAVDVVDVVVVVLAVHVFFVSAVRALLLPLCNPPSPHNFMSTQTKICLCIFGPEQIIREWCGRLSRLGSIYGTITTHTHTRTHVHWANKIKRNK